MSAELLQTIEGIVLPTPPQKKGQTKTTPPIKTDLTLEIFQIQPKDLL